LLSEHACAECELNNLIYRYTVYHVYGIGLR